MYVMWYVLYKYKLTNRNRIFFYLYTGLQFSQIYPSHGRGTASISNSQKLRGCALANFNEDAERIQLSVVSQSVEDPRQPLWQTGIHALGEA